MIMASTTYKPRGNSDHMICVHLMAGFTGQLKEWWDNALTEEGTTFIQTSLNESGNQNSIHTLVFTITKHFLRDPIVFQAHTSEILPNIRYRKLSDYRWYKEVYFSKIHSRTDVNQPYWKEKFLNGLANLRILKHYRDVL